MSLMTRNRVRTFERGRGGVLRDLDWVLLAAAVSLTLYGCLLVWSASLSDMASPSDPTSYLRKHLINVAIALTLGALAMRVDYRGCAPIRRFCGECLFSLCCSRFFPGSERALLALVRGSRFQVVLPFNHQSSQSSR